MTRALRWWCAVGGVAIQLACGTASGHSASDAYLNVDIAAADSSITTGPAIRVQWDIALRDLDFVVRLDDDGDGRITWGELKRHQAAIARYARDRLSFAGDGKPCDVVLAKQMVDSHADGGYAALFLDVRCPRDAERLVLDYRLFFDVDPSHRAITIVRSGADVATAVLSPERRTIGFALRPSKPR